MNNLEFAKAMQKRTMTFSVAAVKFFAKLPRTDEARVPGKQFMRAATSVGANYRSVCRAKSPADFISKMGTVVEEADECLFWLELMEASGVAPALTLAPLKNEAEEVLRVLSRSPSTAKLNSRKPPLSSFE